MSRFSFCRSGRPAIREVSGAPHLHARLAISPSRSSAAQPRLTLLPASRPQRLGRDLAQDEAQGQRAAEPPSAGEGRRRHSRSAPGKRSSRGPSKMISVAPADLQQIAGLEIGKQQSRLRIRERLPRVLKKRLPLKSGTSRAPSLSIATKPGMPPRWETSTPPLDRCLARRRGGGDEEGVRPGDQRARTRRAR